MDIAYLSKDKVTQMGHDPEKYEIWHKELEALKKQSEREQWPGAWGDKTTKDQWSMIELTIGRKLEKCTDGELAKGLEAIRKEIKRRGKARKKVADDHPEQIKKLTAKGYVPLPQAGKEVRRVIREHKIFQAYGPTRQLSKRNQSHGQWAALVQKGRPHDSRRHKAER